MSPVSNSMRELVRRSVIERRPIDDAERASIARFVAEYDRLHDPFDRCLHATHVTGSAIVVGPRGVVLLRHKRLGLWLQPGGHLDRGETPWGAARREAREETGLLVELVGDAESPALVHVDVHPGGRGHTHLDLRYLAEAGDADPSPGADESQEIAWFDWPAAVERAGDPRLAACLAALSSGR